MSDRGEISDFLFEEVIFFNGQPFTKDQIEIDHINFGLNKEKTGLNKKKRSSFTSQDIGRFLKLLDGHFMLPKLKDQHHDFFAVEMKCPLKTEDFGKSYRMVFAVSHAHDEKIFTVTLFRIREKKQ